MAPSPAKAQPSNPFRDEIGKGNDKAGGSSSTSPNKNYSKSSNQGKKLPYRPSKHQQARSNYWRTLIVAVVMPCVGMLLMYGIQFFRKQFQENLEKKAKGSSSKSSKGKRIKAAKGQNLDESELPSGMKAVQAEMKINQEMMYDLAGMRELMKGGNPEVAYKKSFWTPANEGEFLDFLLSEDRFFHKRNGVILAVHMPECVFCQKLATDLNLYFAKHSQGIISYKHIHDSVGLSLEKNDHGGQTEGTSTGSSSSVDGAEGTTGAASGVAQGASSSSVDFHNLSDEVKRNITRLGGLGQTGLYFGMADTNNLSAEFREKYKVPRSYPAIGLWTTEKDKDEASPTFGQRVPRVQWYDQDKYAPLFRHGAERIIDWAENMVELKKYQMEMRRMFTAVAMTGDESSEIPANPPTADSATTDDLLKILRDPMVKMPTLSEVKRGIKDKFQFVLNNGGGEEDERTGLPAVVAKILEEGKNYTISTASSTSSSSDKAVSTSAAEEKSSDANKQDESLQQKDETTTLMKKQLEENLRSNKLIHPFSTGHVKRGNVFTSTFGKTNLPGNARMAFFVSPPLAKLATEMYYKVGKLEQLKQLGKPSSFEEHKARKKQENEIYQTVIDGKLQIADSQFQSFDNLSLYSYMVEDDEWEVSRGGRKILSSAGVVVSGGDDKKAEEQTDAIAATSTSTKAEVVVGAQDEDAPADVSEDKNDNINKFSIYSPSGAPAKRFRSHTDPFQNGLEKKDLVDDMFKNFLVAKNHPAGLDCKKYREAVVARERAKMLTMQEQQEAEVEQDEPIENKANHEEGTEDASAPRSTSSTPAAPKEVADTAVVEAELKDAQLAEIKEDKAGAFGSEDKEKEDSEDEKKQQEEQLPVASYHPCSEFIITRAFVHADQEDTELMTADSQYSFINEEEARNFLLGQDKEGLPKLKGLMYPAYGRVYPESLRHEMQHGVNLIVLVTNKRVTDPKLLQALEMVQPMFHFMAHAGWTEWGDRERDVWQFKTNDNNYKSKAEFDKKAPLQLSAHFAMSTVKLYGGRDAQGEELDLKGIELKEFSRPFPRSVSALREDPSSLAEWIVKSMQEVHQAAREFSDNKKRQKMNLLEKAKLDEAQQRFEKNHLMLWENLSKLQGAMKVDEAKFEQEVETARQTLSQFTGEQWEEKKKQLRADLAGTTTGSDEQQTEVDDEEEDGLLDMQELEKQVEKDLLEMTEEKRQNYILRVLLDAQLLHAKEVNAVMAKTQTEIDNLQDQLDKHQDREAEEGKVEDEDPNSSADGDVESSHNNSQVDVEQAEEGTTSTTDKQDEDSTSSAEQAASATSTSSKEKDGADVVVGQDDQGDKTASTTGADEVSNP
ncbi:unnamed protein product [Amoebophrya sp. A120]|nr:unnamed protein product [Amoebophrya sp. A120]|eukprot:GSA120T00007329001.1